MSVCKVQLHNGLPALIVDGVPLPPMAMTTFNYRKSKSYEHLKALGQAGIRLFYLPADLPWDNPTALKKLCDDMDILLRAVPNAYIIIRIRLHPSADWVLANPEETVTYNDGSHKALEKLGLFWKNGASMPAMYSLASPKWRSEAGNALSKLIDWLEQQPFAQHIIGYLPCAGSTSEWYYQHGTVDREDGRYGDFSSAFRSAQSELLREKYHTSQALREAWDKADIDFDTAPIPDMHSRCFSWFDEVTRQASEQGQSINSISNETNIGSFLNADQLQNVFDFYRNWHHSTADSIIHFARIIKEKTAQRCITGAFYGGSRRYIESGSSAGVLRILNSDAIDFLASPGHYENRKPGGTTAQRMMQDSFRIYGKLFISEDDTRTHLADDGSLGESANGNTKVGKIKFRTSTGTHTLADSLTIMKRDFACDICEDTHGWWFDMSMEQLGQEPWYDHPKILELISRQQQIARLAYESDRRKPAEIAFIFDEESMLYVSQDTTEDLVKTFRMMEAHRIGVPVDYYYHNDLAKAEMPDYKVYVFVNVFALTKAERKVINDKVKRNNQVALWLYGQGFICPDMHPKLSESYISNLVDIPVSGEDIACRPNFKITQSSHPILADAIPERIQGYFDRPIISGGVAGLELGQAPTSLLCPLFYPDDSASDITVLGRYTENDKTAMAMRQFDNWTSIYCGSKTIGSDVLRSIARFVGCHVYCDSDDYIYANNQFVAIHAAQAGKKFIQFPTPCNPYEIYQRRSYGRGVTKIEINMAEGETLMFHLHGPC
ncbi:MAG: hypothetical protein K8R02_06265 [Anaerohalosphaeraceae bacterium]|nr:hypothetical protein [Anaerohalosphaeraceae bacterium]